MTGKHNCTHANIDSSDGLKICNLPDCNEWQQSQMKWQEAKLNSGKIETDFNRKLGNLDIMLESRNNGDGNGNS